MKVAAAVLAAGASRRLGRPKQLERRQGEALVRRAARLAREAGCDPVLVVLGFEAERIGTELRGLAVQAVRNPVWEEGMAASIRCAVEALPPETGGLLLVTCDQWALEAADLGRLLDAFRAAPDRVAAAGYGGGQGIPAVFPASSFEDLSALSGDRGARSLLGCSLNVVEMPTAAPDLDTEADLQGLD
ncbi:MAG TPA: nucleotidyltransferase family protein [Holophagaceae bacterium]|nr:nucleotidyltransferase family protein [Holophagaceae bacterium]